MFGKESRQNLGFRLANGYARMAISSRVISIVFRATTLVVISVRSGRFGSPRSDRSLRWTFSSSGERFVDIEEAPGSTPGRSTMPRLTSSLRTSRGKQLGWWYCISCKREGTSRSIKPKGYRQICGVCASEDKTLYWRPLTEPNYCVFSPQFYLE